MLGQKQTDFLKSEWADINILSGSVRSGKTHVLGRLIHYLAHHGPPKGVLVGKTLETLRENILEPMCEEFQDVSYSDRGKVINIGGVRVRGVGAHNERSHHAIQGDTRGWAVGDEVVLWPKSFFDMLQTRLSIDGAKFFGSCNPGSPYHWLKTDFLEKEGASTRLYNFFLDDNPSNSEEYKKRMTGLYSGVFHKRFILGLWVLAEGIIYDMWEDDRHFVNEIGNWSRFFVDVDYGTSNPCTFSLKGYNGYAPPVQTIKEYWFDSKVQGRQKTDSQYADDMIEFLGGIIPEAVYVDPSAASFKLELQRRGLPVISANNDVNNGIRYVSNLLSQGLYTVHDSCKETRNNYESYIWDKKKQAVGEDAPVKENDHACFVAGTKVATIDGDKNIEEIEAGELVLTRNGYQRVSSTINREADVGRYHLGDKVLIATGCHPVYTVNRGFVRIDSISKGDELLWLKVDPTTGCHSGYIQKAKGIVTESISEALLARRSMAKTFSIGRFLPSTMVRFRRAFTFTTRILIHSIMIHPTLSYCLKMSTFRYMQKGQNGPAVISKGCGLKRSGRYQWSGIAPKRGLNGTGNKEKTSIMAWVWLKKYAKNVAENFLPKRLMRLLQGFAPTGVNQCREGKAGLITLRGCAGGAEKSSLLASTVRLYAAPVSAVAKYDHIRSEIVYNLTVENRHEYFANGILVSNCDRDRYGLYTKFGSSSGMGQIRTTGL